jgi:heat-inducible transcriptional repressor
MDATNLPQLTRRQEEILSMIVRAYTQYPEPVSSKFLVETYALSWSSATIRNEMKVLEDLGYIGAPHTSAGRVPTEAGYRYFVRNLMHNGDLTATEQTSIREKFERLPMVTERWMRYAVTTLARTAQTAALVTSPSAQTGRFKHLELVMIQGRLVLMVLVLVGGTVQQRMLTLNEPVAQSALSEAAGRINRTCEGLKASEMLVKAVQLPVLEREVVELAAEVIDRQGDNMIYREGLSEVINAFPETSGAQQAVRVFEEGAFLNLILDEFLGPAAADVQVVIAGEGRREELSQLSMVLGRYGVPGQIGGALGVLGPTHINYGRAISSVRYVSTLMTNMMAQLYGEDDPATGEDDAPQGVIFTDPIKPDES